jgi:hypothetical protein
MSTWANDIMAATQPIGCSILKWQALRLASPHSCHESVTTLKYGRASGHTLHVRSDEYNMLAMMNPAALTAAAVDQLAGSVRQGNAAR